MRRASASRSVQLLRVANAVGTTTRKRSSGSQQKRMSRSAAEADELLRGTNMRRSGRSRFGAAVLSVGVVSVRVMGDLRLAELTQDNLSAAVGLTLKPGQEKFVAPVVESIAEAYVTPTAWPRVVVDGDRVVGFVMEIGRASCRERVGVGVVG